MIKNVNVIYNGERPEDAGCIVAVSFDDLSVLVFHILKKDLKIYQQLLDSFADDEDCKIKIIAALRSIGLKTKGE